MKNIAAALDKFHQLCPNIPKSAANPYFNSRYSPLDEILPAIKGPLHEAGLTFTQIPVDSNQLKTIIIHVDSGETIEGQYLMEPSKNDPQGRGAAITYARRFALVAMLGLNTDEDDDGNGASGKGSDKELQKPQSKPAPKQEKSAVTDKPNLKKLIEELAKAGITPQEALETLKYKKGEDGLPKVPDAATDLLLCKDETAAKILEVLGYLSDAVIEYRALAKP